MPIYSFVYVKGGMCAMDNKKTIVTIIRDDAPNSSIILSQDTITRMANVTGLNEQQILLGLDTLERWGAITRTTDVVH